MSKPVRIGAAHVLAPPDVAACVRIGTARNAANARAHKTDQRHSDRSSLDVSIQGVIGEYVFLRLFGLPVQDTQDTRCRNVLNDTFDATLAGKTVDVKTVAAPGCDLWVSRGKAANPPHVFALIELQRPRRSKDPYDDPAEAIVGIFHGFCTRQDAFDIRKSTVDRMRLSGSPGSQIITPRDQLREFKDLDFSTDVLDMLAQRKTQKSTAAEAGSAAVRVHKKQKTEQ